MAAKLHKSAYGHAKSRIREKRCARGDRDAWSDHQPSATREGGCLRIHGWVDYGKGQLGVDDDEQPESRGRYKFPYGDFHGVHRCALVAAEGRVGRYRRQERERAADLRGVIDEGKH
jgi:hypothetical protein